MRRVTPILLAVCLVSGSAPARCADLKIDAGLTALRHTGSAAATRALPAHSSVPPAMVGPGERIPCFIRGRVSKADLVAMGIPAGTEAGGVVTAQLTWDDLARVSALPGVDLIQLSRRAHPMLDSSRTAIQAGVVQGGTPPNYAANGITGSGVVVGICDTGIDWTHADFKDKNGLNRIQYIWDQNGAGPAPGSFGYGTEWNAAQISAGSCTEMDDDGHGTHVSGIAAGSGRGTGNGKANYRYVGVAPEADIVFVKIESSFGFTYIIDGVNYIFQKAAALGKPAVVNLSLGSNYGPRDGTDANELALSALSGPGRIVCVSAGNTGTDSIHAEVTVAPGGTSTTTLFVPAYSAYPGSLNDEIDIDAYYHVGDSISVKVKTPGNTDSVTAAFRTIQAKQMAGSKGYVYVDNGGSAGNPLPNGQYNLYIRLYDALAGAPPAAGTWTITLTGTHIHAGGHVDLWMADAYLGGVSELVPWRTGHTAAKEIATPSTAESVLCVAAYSTRNTWRVPAGGVYTYGAPVPVIGDIADFSARGPTADGRMYPTVAAPGFGVASTRSSAVAVGTWMVEDSVHFIDQGTSMACPQVVGVAALILQNHTNATPSLVKAAIADAAIQDAFTGATPNASWGAGKLSALAARSTTPVELYALEGLEVPEGFEVSWAVGEGLYFERFRVLRAAAASGPWTDLTPEPLAGGARSFVDRPVPGVWFYEVQGVRHGTVQTLGPFRAEVTGSSRLSLGLLPPVPNPFRAGTLLSFVVPGVGASQVELVVFDAAGRRVTTLFSGPAPPGRHDVNWNGRRTDGTLAGSGLYFVKLRTEAGTRTRKVALLR
jgi:subtilisin family serine protease